MAISPAVKHQRARVARLCQSYSPDHPKLVDARRDLAATRLEEHVRRVVAEAPPLSDEQRDKIANLLRGGTDSGGAA
jgi:hypothetical protein